MQRILRVFLTVSLGLAGLILPANAAPNNACGLGSGNYIVTYKSGISTSDEIKNVRGRQIKPKYKFDHAFNGFAESLSSDEACDLKNNPKIQDIELDGIITADATVSQSPAPS